jgi:hypothetical protein
MQGRSAAGRAEERDYSAECLDPVSKAEDAGAAAGVGAADAVVMDPKGEGAAAAVHYPDVDDRCLRMLCSVGERLGGGVIASSERAARRPVWATNAPTVTAMARKRASTRRSPRRACAKAAENTSRTPGSSLPRPAARTRSRRSA